MYAVSAFFVKLSLFLLYLRLFKPNRNTRWLIYGGTFACGAFYASSIISNCVLCVPKPGGQNNATTWVLASRRCSAASEQLAIAQGVFSAVGDVYLLVIPIHSIFRLRLPLNRKIGVSAIFMIGIMSVYLISIPLFSPIFGLSNRPTVQSFAPSALSPTELSSSK